MMKNTIWVNKEHELTDQQTFAGHLISPDTVKVIENLITAIATQKLNLVATPGDMEFFTQNSFLAGQLEILQHLLDCNLAALNAAKNPQQHTVV